MRATLLAMLLLCASPGLFPGSAPARAAVCDTPVDLLDPIPLPRLRPAIAAGELRILIGGSATAEAAGAATYHSRLAALLQNHFPTLALRVEARGRAGATAAESLVLILREMPGFRPHLVLWQTGTVEAVRSLELDEMSDTLGEGITRIRAAGADVALLDQQFSRFLRANADIDSYRNAMRMVAAAEGVPLMRRYDWMRHWMENDGPDMERAPRAERAATLAQLNDCLARAIAAQLRHSARR